MARRCPMKKLATYLDEYLELRRKLGFRRLAGGLLHRFVLFAQEKRASFITTKLAVQWATQPGRLPTLAVGQPPRDSAPLCPLRERHRSTHRDSAARAVAASLSSKTSLPLQRPRSSTFDLDRSTASFAQGSSRLQTCDVVRVIGRDGNAGG